MDCYILPALRTLPLSRVTTARVEEWRDELATKLAAATVNAALSCLQSAFTYFVEKRRWVDKNPCSRVERIEGRDRDYLWIQTVEEINQLLLNVPGDVRDIVALMLGSGIRVDEALCLEHGDVDLEKRLITVQHGSQGTTKNGKVRRVPILDAVLPMLRQRGIQRGGARLLFPGKEGKRRAPQAVRRAFKRAAKRAGLNTKLRLYDCRHTFASHWVMNGGDIFALAKVLGHSSVIITERFYAHLRPDHWVGDYARVRFHVPAEAPVYEFIRDESNKVVDRKLRAVG
jgi:integrase